MSSSPRMVTAGTKSGLSPTDKPSRTFRTTWVPYTTTGKITLPAHGGSRSGCSVVEARAKLYARPLGNTTTFRSQMGEGIDYYFFAGPDLDDVVAAYRNATGAAPMWPKWAYGFWQCRERYSSSQQILDTVAQYQCAKDSNRPDCAGLAILGQPRMGGRYGSGTRRSIPTRKS